MNGSTHALAGERTSRHRMPMRNLRPGYRVIVVAMAGLLATHASPALADETGWAIGGGGKVYGGYKTACQAFLKETEQGDVKYVIDRFEETSAGDQRCYHKNAADKEPAVSYTLVYRTRRTPINGQAWYRGSLRANRTVATTTNHFLGPGVYYTTEPSVARSYAIADYSYAWVRAPKAKIKPATVIEVDVDVNSLKVLDFSQGEELTAFEDILKATKLPGLNNLPADAKLSIYKNGTVNPVAFHNAFLEYLKSKQHKLTDFQVVIGPDYRHNSKMIVLRDQAVVARIDKTAATQYEFVTFPSKQEVIDLLQEVPTCAATTESKCKVWSERAGMALMNRRGWRSNHMRGGDGLHYFLRFGDLYIDGTYMQFHIVKKADPTAAALFVGSEVELRAELAEFPQKEGEKAEQWFERFFVPLADTYENSQTKRPIRFGFADDGRAVLMDDGN